MSDHRHSLMFLNFLFLAAVSTANDVPTPSSIIQQSITLEECIRLAFDNSPDLKYARDAIQVENLKIDESRTDFLPSPSLSISHNKIIDVSEFRFYDPQTGQSFVPGEGYELSLTVNAPIYTGSRLTSTLRTNKYARQSLELSLRTLERDLWLKTVSTYLTVLERQAELQIRAEQVKKADEALKLAQNRLAIGTGIQYEVYLEEAYAAQSNLEYLQAEHQLQNAIRTLLLISHLPLDTAIDPEPVPMPKRCVLNQSDLLLQTHQHREDFEKIQTDIHRLQSELSVIQSINRPTVNLFTSYGKQGNDLGSFANDDDRWTAGVSIQFSPFNNATLASGTYRDKINSLDYMQRSYLTFSAFNGSSTRSRQMVITAGIRKNQENLRTLADTIDAQVLRAYELQAESWTALHAEELNLRAADENNRIQEKSYELGLNQFKDVIDARADVVTARIRLTYSQYRYAFDRASLDYAIGLTPWKEIRE